MQHRDSISGSPPNTPKRADPDVRGEASVLKAEGEFAPPRSLKLSQVFVSPPSPSFFCGFFSSDAPSDVVLLAEAVRQSCLMQRF